MPAGDGTGPMGLGPLTGRAAGYCAGYGVPGYMNPIPGCTGWGYGALPLGGPVATAAWRPSAGVAGGGAYGYPFAWRPFGFRRRFGRGWGRGFGRGFGRGWGRGRGGRFGYW